MAYREFRNEAYYEAPDTGRLFEGTMSTIQHVMAQRVSEKKANKLAAERFKLDSQKGYYASDQDILDKEAREITSNAINELKSNGTLSSDTALRMQDYKSTANRSKLDWDTAQNVRKQIQAISQKDKYYVAKVDYDKLVSAEYEGTITDRNDRIQQVAQSLAGLDTFNKDKFLSDYVQKQKLNKMEVITDKSGVKTTKMTSAIFMRPDGIPGVTDDHIVDYFNSDSRIEEWYNNEAEKTIRADIKKMKAMGNDSNVSWMKGMSDEDILTAIVDNPNLNIVNPKPFSQRKKDMASEDLIAGQDMNKKTSVDYSDTYNSNGGRFANTKIGFQPTSINQAINLKTLNGAKQAGSVGADLTYVDKGGPIKFVTNSPIRANVGTGEVDTKASDHVEFNLTNFGLYVYDQKGQLYPLSGTNIDELKKSIDAIPDRYFDSNAAHPLADQMSVGLNGYAINKSKLINQSLDKRSQLAEEYNKAINDGDEIKASQIKNRMDQVEQLRSMATNSDVDDLQLLLNGKMLGISGVQNDLIIKASDQDFAKLKTITNGLDLRDQSKWTDDMRDLSTHYRQRVLQARQNLNTPAKPSKTKVVKAKIITPEEFNAKWTTLKSGQSLIGPDGKTYIKK